MLLQISQLGHPSLRQQTIPIDFRGPSKLPFFSDLDDLIENMIETCEDANGVGIAAPQVYRPLQVFIINSKPNARYPNAPKMGPRPIINPRILARSRKKVLDWEGCLSIPGIRGLVPRHESIKVSFYTSKGQKETMELDGFVARIFQHEFDHLQGVVFLDRTKSCDLVTEKEYLKIMAKAK